MPVVLDTNAELVENFWDYERNEELPINVETFSKTKLIWFKCRNGHSFQDRPRIIASRTQETFCIECNSVSFMRPKALANWDYSKNLKAPNITSVKGGRSGFWLICNRRHSFHLGGLEGDFLERCELCRSFAIKYPDYLKFWDYKANLISPENFRYEDGKAWPWFKCENGHGFQADRQRIEKHRKDFCPECTSPSVATVYPKLLKYWDYSQNPAPEHTAANANGKFFFLCPKGHSFVTTINNFPKQKKEFCRECRIEELSFAALHPESAKLWNYERNEKDPKEILVGARGRFWFKCNANHSFTKELRWFVDNPGVCPHCSSQTSRLEVTFGNYLQYELKLKVERNTRKLITPYEIDMYIPAKGIAFEFNGDYSILVEKPSKFTSAIEQHTNKLRLAKAKHVTLAFVWGHDWTSHQEYLKLQIQRFVAGESLANLEMLTKLESVIDTPCKRCSDKLK